MGEEHYNLGHAPISTIISTGLLLGIVHVITGPDHLSALVVLSAGSSWRSCQLGMRWGCGHSTGLILVTIIFLSVNQSFDVDGFGKYCDFVVGILMIILGLWSMRHYIKMRREQRMATCDPDREGTTQTLEVVLSPAVNASPNMEPKTSFTCADSDFPTPNDTAKAVDDVRKPSFDETIVTKKCCGGICLAPSSDIKNPSTQRWTAFAYGVAHGLAGTGGILGVLPAVVLNNWGRSSAYLLSFCVSSIFIMGVFAATYGEITGRLSQYSETLLYRIGIFSSCVSLVVGIIWVTLSATGQLDAVFG
ncbi:TPA: hypothetical protein N0F65_009338 [Lagenidium giganteum]|uniref:Uncharacterized protein n=1 Tax=Lagenidium giganteum TaxID=4803 RepID=A0AAV2YF67_9STRA|nr:TPA: hypothetical protein N0F65_009338 [Lagenidium giganteum]